MRGFSTQHPAAAGLLALALLAGGPAQAADGHKLAFQVSDADPEVQSLTLANAANVQKQYGMDEIAVEVVAFGPGIGLLTADSAQTERVKNMAMQNITFSACNNTLQAIARKTGKTPVLTEGVQVVPSGAGRLMELQEQGYAYIRP